MRNLLGVPLFGSQHFISDTIRSPILHLKFIFEYNRMKFSMNFIWNEGARERERNWEYINRSAINLLWILFLQCNGSIWEAKLFRKESRNGHQNEANCKDHRFSALFEQSQTGNQKISQENPSWKWIEFNSVAFDQHATDD